MQSPPTLHLLKEAPEIDAATADPASVAAAVRQELAAVEAAHRRAVTHAWRAGDLLTTMRGRLGHGEWLPWLAGAGIEVRTAQRLIAIRRHCPTAAAAAQYSNSSQVLAAAREARQKQTQGALDLDAKPVTDAILTPTPSLPAPGTRPAWPSRVVEFLARLLRRVAHWIKVKNPSQR